MNIENSLYFSVSGCGEMKLGLFLTETHLQVEIVSARNITWNSNKLGQNKCKFSSPYTCFKTIIP